MIRTMLTCLIVGFTVATAAPTSAPAATLAYDDILGSWCGTAAKGRQTKYVFTRETMVVTHPPDEKKRTLKIVRYEFTDTSVTVFYQAGGKTGAEPGRNPFKVKFSEFGADRKTMYQDTKDRYQFTRC